MMDKPISPLRRRLIEDMTVRGFTPATQPSMNAAVSALRFCLGVALDRRDAQTGLTTVREPRRLSVILSPEEVARLLDAAAAPERSLSSTERHCRVAGSSHQL